MLECAAVELAAKRITQAQLDDLDKLILPPPTGRTPNREQAELYGRSNILFHRSIAIASGNRALVDALTRVLKTFAGDLPDLLRLPVHRRGAGDHSAIVEALRDRDVARARTVVKRHIETTRVRLLRALVGTGDVRFDVSPKAGRSAYRSGAPRGS